MSQTSDVDPQESAGSLEQAQLLDEFGPQEVVYEFTMAQNEVIRGLAEKMKFVGFIYVFIGGLMGLISVIALFIIPVAGVFYLLLLAPQLLIGIWNISAANSFGLIVETKGFDIPHLMNAIGSLRKLYTVMFWLLVMMLSLVVIGIAAGLFLWSSGSLHIPA